MTLGDILNWSGILKKGTTVIIHNGDATLRGNWMDEEDKTILRFILANKNVECPTTEYSSALDTLEVWI